MNDVDKSYAKGDDQDSKSIDSSRSAEEEEDEEVFFLLYRFFLLNKSINSCL